MQALTTLNLEENEIGNKGAEYLGAALQVNKVKEKLSFIFIIVPLLFIRRH